MGNEKESTPELREDVRRLKREVSILQILHICTCLLIFLWGVRYGRGVDVLSLITERLDFLNKSLELSYETDKVLFDTIKELVCQLQRAFEVLSG